MELCPVPIVDNPIETIMAMTSIHFFGASGSPILLAMRPFNHFSNCFARIWKKVEGPSVLTVFDMILNMEFRYGSPYLLHNRQHSREIFCKALFKIDMIGAKDVILAEHNPPLMMSIGKGKSKNIIRVLKPSDTLALFVSVPKKILTLHRGSSLRCLGVGRNHGEHIE
jgi:hypothetical protein